MFKLSKNLHLGWLTPRRGRSSDVSVCASGTERMEHCIVAVLTARLRSDCRCGPGPSFSVKRRTVAINSSGFTIPFFRAHVRQDRKSFILTCVKQIPESWCQPEDLLPVRSSFGRNKDDKYSEDGVAVMIHVLLDLHLTTKAAGAMCFLMTGSINSRKFFCIGHADQSPVHPWNDPRTGSGSIQVLNQPLDSDGWARHLCRLGQLKRRRPKTRPTWQSTRRTAQHGPNSASVCRADGTGRVRSIAVRP